MQNRYDSWLLHFDIGNEPVSIPIEDNFKNGFILPQRSEIIRRLSNNTYPSEMVVHAQEIQTGIFVGNTIISEDEPYAKFINTTNEPVYINYDQINPTMEPFDNYHVIRTTQEKPKRNDRNEQLMNEVDLSNIPNFIQHDFKNLIEQYADIFCLKDDKLSSNNFYNQDIHLTDNVPVYIPNYKQIHSQTEEVQRQIEKMLQENIIEPSISSYNSIHSFLNTVWSLSVYAYAIWT